MLETQPSARYAAHWTTAVILTVVSVATAIVCAEPQESGGRRGGRGSRPPDPQVVLGYRLTIASGTRAAYRVKEQLLGINFLNDAVGMTQSVKGSLLLRPDGSVDSGQSRLTVDLRTMSSDQEHRDEYINEKTLSVDKFPLVEFVPRRITGLPAPLPYRGQHGVEVVGDMTLRGVTREINWKGIVSYEGPTVGGRLVTNFNFGLFSLPIPKAPARVLSVEDNIVLELDFKMLRGE